MSTRIEALPQRSGHVWPIAVLVLFIVMTVATIATSIDRPERTDAPPSERIVAGLAGGVAANTPSELAGIEQTVVGGTAANTPTELSGGMVGGVSEDNGEWVPTADAVAAFERYRHQRI